MNTPKPDIGDLISCVDGDLGLVLGVREGHPGEHLLRVVWKSGDVFWDPWCSQDFVDGTGMFTLTSRG